MNSSTLHPAVENALKKHGIEYKVMECDPDVADTAAFCDYYGVSPDQSANTILVASRKSEPVRYAVCVVLATTRLDVNKKVCQLLNVKKASFADADTTRELTGMMIGGVTAVGIADQQIYIDSEVMEREEVVMGGGNRSSKLVIHPRELMKLANVEIIAGLARSREA